jgi:hypothetical protein
MSHFRSIFRLVSANGSYQVSDYGPRNDPFDDFLPSDIAGLTGWWDASDAAHITGSGDNVVFWGNKGSAGGYITGANGAGMTTVSAYQNTRQAIYFSTASVGSVWETGGGALVNTLDGSTSKCWFIAFQSNPLLPPSSEVAANDLPSLVIDRFVGVVLSEGTAYPGTDIARWYFDGSDAGFTQFLSSSNVTGKNPASGSNFILSLAAAVTSFPYAHALTMSVNGGVDDTRISTAQMNPGSAVPYGIGSPPTGGQRGKSRERYFYEILFYNTVLTNSERTQVINYLNNKWGIY